MENGLPSNELHGLSIGPKGKLWIASDQGVSVYDGYGFTNYANSQGIQDIIVFDMYRDSKDRMWAVSMSGNLSVFKNGRFNPYEFNQKILDFRGKSSQVFLDFLCDAADNVYISFHSAGLLKIDSSGNSSRINRSMIAPDTRGQYIDALDGDKYVFSDAWTNYRPYTGLSKVKTFLFASDTNIFDYNNEAEIRSNDYFDFTVVGDSLIFSVGNSLFIKHKKEVTEITTDQHIKCFTIVNDEIWIGMLNGGIEVYAFDNLHAIKRSFLDGLTPTDFAQDVDQGIWVSTVEKGLFYIPSIHFSQIISNEIPVLSLATDEQYVYAGKKGGDISKIQMNEVVKDISTNSFTKSPVKKILIEKENIILLKNEVLILTDDRKEVILNFGVNYQGRIKDLYKAPNGEIFLSGLSLHQMNDDFSTRYVYRLDTSILLYNTVCLSSENSFWMGSDIGLFELKNDSMHSYLKHDNLLRSKIICLLRMANGELLIGTKNKGLLLFNPSADEVKKLCLSNNNCDFSVASIKALNDSSIWFATNRGIGHLLLEQGGSKVKQVRHYTRMNGLPSDQVNDIAFQHEYVYAATEKGLSRVAIADLKVEQPPSIILEEMTVSTDTIVAFDGLEFAYNQNDITIRYKGVDLKSNGEISYEYQMVGDKKTINYTSDLSVNYRSLSPGEYTFQVYAINKWGVKSTNPLSISFTINSPFWQEAWFILILLLGVASIIYLGIALVFKTKMHKQEKDLLTRNKIMELEMSVFRAQMNPHFLFNTLHSIRYLISKGLQEESEKYLLKFSKLLRTITNETPHSYITLENELKSLEDYVELEKMRFNNTFEVLVSLASNVSPERIKIPSFILQPFVENAIQHGQIHKKEDGKATLHFDVNDDLLSIRIVDNGIGRKEAEKKNKQSFSSHKSIAISNIKKRLQLINREVDKQVVDLKIKDHYDDLGNSTGTEIVLTIKVRKLDEPLQAV